MAIETDLMSSARAPPHRPIRQAATTTDRIAIRVTSRPASLVLLGSPEQEHDERAVLGAAEDVDVVAGAEHRRAARGQELVPADDEHGRGAGGEGQVLDGGAVHRRGAVDVEGDDV